MWVTTEYDFPYTGTYVQFTIPQDGIYEFEVWGASGAAAKVDSLVAERGLGGHSKGYKKMKKDDVIYIFNGGSPNGTSSGANGGGGGYNYASSKQYGAGGGGSTHVATKSGTLGVTSSSGLSYANRSCVLIVAGGGGGGGIDNGSQRYFHFPASGTCGSRFHLVCHATYRTACSGLCGVHDHAVWAISRA